jgi:hypothetical protein
LTSANRLTAGDVSAGYRLSFLIAAGMGALAVVLVAAVRSRVPRHQPENVQVQAEPTRDL